MEAVSAVVVGKEEDVMEDAFPVQVPKSDVPVYLNEENMPVAGRPQKRQEEKPVSPSAPIRQREEVMQKSGTIYVQTYGAQGHVWGYVTMQGGTGRGTIQDDNENTLTINVTRHGNELHGIDQNGRGYVFKL
ncbi:MAG: hypothetical protein SPJ13_06675 [Bacteroidales bacterium]|nr:hypothetical protein [Bacteroidales bacterium]